jgi:hypothetical protein
MACAAHTHRMRSLSSDIRAAGTHMIMWLVLLTALYYTVWPAPKPSLSVVAAAIFTGVGLGAVLVRLFRS